MSITNTTVVNSLYGRSISGTSTTPFVDIFMPRDPTVNDVQYSIQQKWLNTVTGSFWELQNFTSSLGVVQANWVKIGSVQHLESLTGNVGGAVFPTANNTNIVGDGITTNVTGNPATSTLTISLMGDVSTTYTTNAGSATPVAGNLFVLGVNGITTEGSTDTIKIASDGTIAIDYVTSAGTAIASGEILNVIGTGTVSTSAAGNTLTITGALSPSGFTSIDNQVFTTSGTYTPTAGMTYCSIQCVAGGGAGAGAEAVAAQVSGGPGGSAGEYACGIFTATDIGISQTITIGAGGTGVLGAGGGNGGNTSVGTLISCVGGNGGLTAPAASVYNSNGIPGGTGGTGGDYRSPGAPGHVSSGNFATALLVGGSGASSQLGGGGTAINQTNGNNGVGYGSGGSSATSYGTQGPFTGGNGASGIVIITEYIG